MAVDKLREVTYGLKEEKVAASSGLNPFDQVQVKYGTVVPGTVQPKYGVVDPGTVQPKYGVVDPGTVQPKYGVVAPGVSDIDITFDQLERNIAILRKAIANLKNSWSNETKKNIAKLDNSWVGPDCAAYTQKLTKMNSKVQNTISALELLCSTYERARDMVIENQRSVTSSITGMID